PECRIRDLSSTNGTFLNGKRIVEATLRNLDEIRAGSSTFVLRVEPELSHSPKREPVSDRTEGERDFHRGRPSASQEPSAGTEDMGPTPGRVSVEEDADMTARLAETPSRGELLQITNRTPFRTATLYWQDEQGRAKLTIIVKATFAMGTPV